MTEELRDFTTIPMEVIYDLIYPLVDSDVTQNFHDTGIDIDRLVEWNWAHEVHVDMSNQGLRVYWNAVVDEQKAEAEVEKDDGDTWRLTPKGKLVADLITKGGLSYEDASAIAANYSVEEA